MRINVRYMIITNTVAHGVVYVLECVQSQLNLPYLFSLCTPTEPNLTTDLWLLSSCSAYRYTRSIRVSTWSLTLKERRYCTQFRSELLGSISVLVLHLTLTQAAIYTDRFLLKYILQCYYYIMLHQ
jgi:hypothetical protein